MNKASFEDTLEKLCEKGLITKKKVSELKTEMAGQYFRYYNQYYASFSGEKLNDFVEKRLKEYRMETITNILQDIKQQIEIDELLSML